MKRLPIFAYYYLKSEFNKRNTRPDVIREYLQGREILPGSIVFSAHEINAYIYDKIISNEPFFAGRFGATELFALSTFDFERKSKYLKVMEQMSIWSGMFPDTIEMGMRFKDEMLQCISQVDIMGLWLKTFEDYYLTKYGKKQMVTTYLLDLEPWSSPEKPWSAALEGKRVLVIHPFTETIKRQYERRKEIFPNTNILPLFDLITLKAVQTIAGETDDRFNDWFDALEWMFEEAMKIEFDIAIIGCGAYGFPLSARLKSQGKQVIHLAGATQLLFGIKGKRWEDNSAFEYVQRFFNDAWVYPDDCDKPKHAQKVEGGCYW